MKGVVSILNQTERKTQAMHTGWSKTYITYYYGLAVKTGSIALQKFLFFLFFFGLWEKVGFLGSK